MKYKKNKLRLIEIASAIQSFTFWVNLVWFLSNFSFNFIEKNMFNFSFEKHVPSQVFEGFSVENLETTPSNLRRIFFSETLYLT